jgi:hypothetical protein
MEAWGIAYLWRSTFLMERFAIVGLALMLTYVIVASVFVSHCLPAAYAKPSDFANRRLQRKRKPLLANLSISIGLLKSISLTAPYLGVAGTCLGLLDTLSVGYSGTRSSVFAALASGEDAALLSTAVGLVVAVPAIASHNYLRARLETLQQEIPQDFISQRRSHYQVAQRLPLSPRFSRIAIAPALAIFILVFAGSWSFGPPTGLTVHFAPGRCEFDGRDRQIVLHLTEGDKLLINTEQVDRGSLEFRLSMIYRLRAHRILYLLADDGVRYQNVADAIDIAENTRADVAQKESDSLDISVELITHKTMADRCPQSLFTPSEQLRKK